MTKFWAHMHVGHTMSWAGDSWEEGGFDVDPDGNPTHDPKRNTVAGYSADPVELPEDAGLVRDAYAGDEAIGDSDAFVAWLEEQGFDAEDRTIMLRRFDFELTHRCIYCDRAVPHRETVPPATDDEAWDELATEHYEDCEWVATRAHRRELVE